MDNAVKNKFHSGQTRHDNERKGMLITRALRSGGLMCKLGVLCFYSSSVQVDSFVLRNPPERKARNRQRSLRDTSTV